MHSAEWSLSLLGISGNARKGYELGAKSRPSTLQELRFVQEWQLLLPTHSPQFPRRPSPGVGATPLVGFVGPQTISNDFGQHWEGFKLNRHTCDMPIMAQQSSTNFIFTVSTSEHDWR